jgi:hypothetical protein
MTPEAAITVRPADGVPLTVAVRETSNV